MVNKKKEITIAQQFIHVKVRYPKSKMVYRDGKWIIKVLLQPTPVSPFYPIELIKNSKGSFDVWLVGNIRKIEDSNFPHKYYVDIINKRVKLCLYHPKKYEWSRFDKIAITIIPWVCEWLYYYELWLDDGEWRGGGEHPIIDD